MIKTLKSLSSHVTGLLLGPIIIHLSFSTETPENLGAGAHGPMPMSSPSLLGSDEACGQPNQARCGAGSLNVGDNSGCNTYEP